jgi:4-amino-4-deoxy-L-arabinose transferase-like glycosyltransferase
MATLQVSSVMQESQTFDEAVYIAAGYSYWKTGDFRLNPEHPPLAKLLVAAPLLPLRLALPLDDPSWRDADEYAFGARFLYHNRMPADAILLRARSVTILVTLLFGLTVALWVRRRAGTLAALFALTFFAFDPNVLAHGRYATNDLYLAFFFFLSVVLWNRALRQGSVTDYILAGLAFGLVLSTKLSGAVVVPVAILLCLRRGLKPAAVLAGSVVTALIAVAVVTILYHGQLHYYRDMAADSIDHAKGGQLAYLFGSTFRHGLWYFYPAVVAVKTPLGVAGLFAVAAIATLRRRAMSGDASVLLTASVLYFLVCLASPIDLGIRILLPAYVFFYAFVALSVPLDKWKWPLALSAALLIAESASIYPNYLAFFNAAGGGPGQGPRYLLDSNIDWGQDTKKLKWFLDKHDIHDACTAYFGMAYPFYYGIVQRPWVGYVNPQNRSSLNCVVAVSVTWLYGGPAIAGPTWGWLRSQTPDAKIGYSIYVFDFRKRRVSGAAVQQSGG